MEEEAIARLSRAELQVQDLYYLLFHGESDDLQQQILEYLGEHPRMQPVFWERLYRRVAGRVSITMKFSMEKPNSLPG